MTASAEQEPVDLPDTVPPDRDDGRAVARLHVDPQSYNGNWSRLLDRLQEHYTVTTEYTSDHLTVYDIEVPLKEADSP